LRRYNTAAREDREDNAAAEASGTATAGARWGADLGEDRQASSASPAADAEFSAERTAAMEALGHEPDIYDRLVSSLAPSIWEMEEVKRGLLCQLFGATSKVFKAGQETRVQMRVKDVTGNEPDRYRSSRQRMPSNSRNEDPPCVG
jgi:hypothetical protein